MFRSQSLTPMRICSPHCGIDPESSSGGETYERELLRHLAARGAVVDILLARHKRHPEGVPNWIIHRLPIGRGLRWPVAMLLLPPIIARLHAETRFDLLRVHSLRYIGPAALIARRRYRLDVPIVSHHHHLDRSLLNPVIERRVVEGSERVITVSKFSRRQLVETLGVDADRIEVVPNGIDVRFAPGGGDRVRQRHGLGDRPVALYLGGLKRRKNLPLLLDAWREVANARPDARLLIAGGGSLETGLRRRVVALGLGDGVVFTGRIAEAEKVGYYNAADLFVSPSSLEGFGFTVGEAMSCGLPVVVSDRGALPELVMDGEGGFVCRHDDPGELARRILLLLGDPELRRRLGGFNRERIDRHFRWERASRRVLEIYQEVLAEWKRGLSLR
jgi:phosphatidyl-myo-inositol dimannoside synthase